MPQSDRKLTAIAGDISMQLQIEGPPQLNYTRLALCFVDLIADQYGPNFLHDELIPNLKKRMEDMYEEMSEQEIDNFEY